MPTDFKRTEFNLWVLRNYNKAMSLADKLYWKSLFV